MSKENRNYRDSVFVDLFFRYRDAKVNALSLYNALSGSHYDNPEAVRMLKLEDTVYKDFQNDISFLIGEKIFVLGEHQSTINENMPLRFLLYIGRLYETLLEVEDRYKEKRIPLPTPEFYVFYNGDKEYPAHKILRLSDSFLVKGKLSDFKGILCVCRCCIKVQRAEGKAEICNRGVHAEGDLNRVFIRKRIGGNEHVDRSV